MAANVFLYALSTCIHCRNTKRFLDENNIDYSYVDVDKLQGEEREKVVEEIKQINPKISFPTILIDNNKTIVGLKKDEILEACGK